MKDYFVMWCVFLGASTCARDLKVLFHEKLIIQINLAKVAVTNQFYQLRQVFYATLGVNMHINTVICICA